jgi:hypothetical protein
MGTVRGRPEDSFCLGINNGGTGVLIGRATVGFVFTVFTVATGFLSIK